MGVITRLAAALALSLLAAGALQQALMAEKVDRLSALPLLAVLVVLVSIVFAIAAWRKVAAERTAIVLLAVMVVIGFAAVEIGLADRSPGVGGDILYGLAEVLVGYFLLPCAVALPIHWLLLRRSEHV